MAKLTIFFMTVVMALITTPAFGRQDEHRVAETGKPGHNGTIVALGNSLTAGRGVPEDLAWPARLERKLRGEGYGYRVVNAGISGETSSGALSRIRWMMTLKPDILILETGANDGLRGVDPALIRDNIDRIITTLKEKKVTIVLAGMQMVRNLGEEYTREFAAIYPSLAKKDGVILIPFFLEGVAADPALNQPDGIHPTAEGHRLIVEHIYPYILEAIRRRAIGPGQ